LIVKIVTNKGEMAIELWEDDAPNTVANFIYLVDKGFYNGLTFHRFEPGRVLQGGDPNGDGSGGPGWRIEGEVSTRRYDAGVIGMADAGVDTGGSQFFFAFGQMQQWDPRYTCFGKIVAGMDVLAQISKGDSIVRMEVLQRRSHAYLPYVYKDGSEKEERLPPIEVKPKESPKP
ncbi:MAG: peptidylprolyl isomerase, partial [Candidatus Brocadiia bacterium]